MATTTTSILPAAVQQSFNYKILSTPTPNLIHKVAAMKLRMPKNGGTTLVSRRYNKLQSANVPLGNSGITPPAQPLTATTISAKIEFYGTYVTINEQVTLTSKDPVLNHAAARLGVCMRQTEDELTRDMLAATVTKVHCVAGANGDNPTEISQSDISDVTRILLGADAYTILDSIEGEDRFGTGPVRSAYFAFAHTDLVKDLEATGGFTHSSQYPSQTNVLRSEWGAVGNLRFLISSIGSKELMKSNKGRSVYNVFAVGLEAYSCIEQDGHSSKFLYRPPIFDGPLALNASAGIKFAEVPSILNDDWIVKLACTVR
jgi:N4-gp56 family major capsid protein